MNSLLEAPRLSLAEVARKLGVSLPTLHRWHQKGLRGRKIRFLRIGARSYITLEEIESWIRHLSDPPAQQERSDDFDRRAAAANKRCDALGI